MKSRFTPEFIKEQRRLLLFDEPKRITIPKTIAEHALDEIERLQQHIAEIEQERRWIPVEELSESIRALVYLDNDYTIIATYHKNTDRWKNDCGAIVENVIKYQPLPQPPQEKR